MGIFHNLYYFVTTLLPSLQVTILHCEECGGFCLVVAFVVFGCLGFFLNTNCKVK